MHEAAGDTTLICPKCQKPMRSLKTGGVVVDRCETCLGLWLDKGEQVKVLAGEDITGLDIGSPELGETYDAVTEIECPRCSSPMMHVQHPAQRHIGYEICPNCGGSFFDAGEISDLSEFTLSERIRGFFGK